MKGRRICRLAHARHDALALLRRALNLPENSGVLDLLDAQADESRQRRIMPCCARAARTPPLQYILREAWLWVCAFMWTSGCSSRGRIRNCSANWP
jgi:hypothetical protein